MNSREWLISHDVDSSKAMCDELDQALKDQREACADKAVAHAIICGLNNDSVGWFRQAMLNARIVKKEI